MTRSFFNEKQFLSLFSFSGDSYVGFRASGVGFAVANVGFGAADVGFAGQFCKYWRSEMWGSWLAFK